LILAGISASSAGGGCLRQIVRRDCGDLETKAFETKALETKTLEPRRSGAAARGRVVLCAIPKYRHRGSLGAVAMTSPVIRTPLMTSRAADSEKLPTESKQGA
jgi:hypothetical protein